MRRLCHQSRAHWQRINSNPKRQIPSPNSMKLVVAEGAILEEVIDATFPIWNEGLTRDGYARWNAAQMRTSWGKDHLQRFALLDDRGRWVASAKQYLWPMRLDGVDGTMCGFGAVFTRPEERGRGCRRHHRTADRARARGRRGRRRAVLRNRRSVVSATWIRQPWRSTKWTCTSSARMVRPRCWSEQGTSAISQRLRRCTPGVPRTSGSRCGATRRSSTTRCRKSACWRDLVTVRGLEPSAETEFFVAEEGVSAVAYVVLTVSAGGWTLEEAGDRDPAGARLGAILQVLLAREPSRPAPPDSRLVAARATGAAPGPPRQPHPRARHLHAAADCESWDPFAAGRGLLLEKRLLLMAQGSRLRAQGTFGLSRRALSPSLKPYGAC